MTGIRARFAHLLRERRPYLPAPLDTRRGLADRVGVAPSVIVNYEDETIFPSTPTLLRLMHVLEITPADLLGVDADVTP